MLLMELITVRKCGDTNLPANLYVLIIPNIRELFLRWFKYAAHLKHGQYAPIFLRLPISLGICL